MSDMIEEAIRCIDNNDITGMKELLENGQDPNSMDAAGKNFLIDYNANTLCSHTNPLKYACGYCTQDVRECLMEKIVFTNEVLADSIVELFGSKGNLSIIKIFLNADVDLNAL